MFLGIDRDAWISIWSGGLGAIPAAVVSAAVAAWVAVTVLNRSILQQQRLAVRAAVHQTKQAAEAASRQAALAEESARQQKALAEQQLAEQKAESARVREQGAIAEAIIVTEELVGLSGGSWEEMRGHRRVLQAAFARWRVELGNVPMQFEVMSWTESLLQAGGLRSITQSHGMKEQDRTAMAVLTDAVTSFTAIALGWATADERGREVVLQKSAVWREQAESNLDDLRNSLGRD